MSSDLKLTEPLPNAQVSKLVIGAIKSLKKIRGSSSEAILQHIRSHESSSIDATDVERCLEIAHAEKKIISRTNKKSGIKFYRISAAALQATNKMRTEIDDEKSNKRKKYIKGKLRSKKNDKSSQKSEEKAEGSNSAESKDPDPEKKNLFCQICKISVSSEKNLEAHEKGKKHRNTSRRITEKEQKKKMKSSNKLTENIGSTDYHSSNAPSDAQGFSLSKSNHDASNRNKSHSRDYRNNYSRPESPSDNNYSPNRNIKEKEQRKSTNSSDKLTETIGSNDYHSSNARSDAQSFSLSESNHDSSNRKKSYSHDYRNRPESSSNDNYSPNCKIKEKEQRKNSKSSHFSDKLTEKMDINDNNSSDAPNDIQYSNPESNRNVSNRMKSHSRDYKNSYSKPLSPSDNYYSPNRKIKEKEQKKNTKSSNSSDRLTENADTNDNHSSDAPNDMQYSIEVEVSNRRRSHSREYRNGYSKPISPCDNYYSPNHREPYYNNRNYDRNYHWDRWSPNQTYRNDPNQIFQSCNRYNRYIRNYDYNQRPWMGNGPPPMFDNWADMPNSERSEFFSENIQSENIQPENIQPVECNTNYETHSNSKNVDERLRTSTDEQKSPSRKSMKVVGDKKGKKSPRIQIKVIPKTTAAPEDVQALSGIEKQPEKGVVLSENMTGKRLAHWINPSNQKDQAEIRRLVTEFSKSKKKANLIKLKLHTDKVSVNNDSNQSAVENNNISSLPTTPEVPGNGNSTQISSETTLGVFSNSSATNFAEVNKRQRSSSFTEIFTSASSPVRLSPSARNRSESLTLDENAKKPQSCLTKRTASNPCESPSNRKRKVSVELGGNSKKHKCSSAECLEKCIESAIANADALTHPERTECVETAPLTVNAAANDISSQKEGVYIKKELVDEIDATQMKSLSLNELIQKQTDVISSCQDDASMTPVESLINLFATGNITIKKEFDDPLIDAIRSIDPALLNKVCEDEADKNGSSQETVEKATEPVLAPPLAIPDTSPVPSSNAPSLTLSLKNILNELQIISEEEEKVKDSLLKADQQIQYYQSVLDEWKTKKIKFQSEEEILRNKRNTLVRTMNDLVEQQSSESRSTTESPVPEERPPSNSSLITNEINNSIGPIITEAFTIDNNHIKIDSLTPPQEDTATEHSVKIEDEDVIPMESDDIVILPVPESRIPVIDLDSLEKSNDADVVSKKNPNACSISANCHKIRELVAHNAVINSIQIFDDYLYTCSNDKTARRFSLKDPTESITYSHAEKNIYHLFVEKMRGKTYVFTCAFNSNLITVFDAESARKVKVYQCRPNIAGMCKGRYKIYVGLRNGSILTCDWKDQKDLVNIEEPIRSIATAHQGGINVLVTLSTKGHVSVRDADRNGLLIKYVKALTHVPLFMSIYNDWVYLSSAGYLSVLDLSSGSFVKKYELPAAYTSLTVYKDHIFTTSFSGFVRCYSKYDIQDVKAYYGAGKMALTCIHAHDGWIFTGNRTGEISVFKFDSETSLPCQFGNCKMVFARLDDLMYHVLQGKDHNLISMKTCLWRKCNISIKSWDQEAIHNHIRAHITASFPYLHEPMYNLTV